VAVIQLSAPEPGEAAAPLAAEVALGIEIESAIKAGTTSFEEAARRHSMHPSAPVGGNIGWRTQLDLGTFGTLAARAVSQLGIGENSGLLRLESGLWFFRVLARRPAALRPFADVRDVVEASLRKERGLALGDSVRREHLDSLAWRRVGA
jgi:peptidyl-prolyl cis-trans isomerase D